MMRDLGGIPEMGEVLLTVRSASLFDRKWPQIAILTVKIWLIQDPTLKILFVLNQLNVRKS